MASGNSFDSIIINDNLALSQYSANGTGQQLVFTKSRGVFPALTANQAADDLGRILFTGNDGAMTIESAAIFVEATALAAAGVAQSKMEFFTSGAAGLTERLEIAATGVVTVAAADAGAVSLISGSGFTVSAGTTTITSNTNAANAIRLRANGGASETIQLHADQGTGVNSVNLLSDVGGITLTATGLASADAINLEASAGGIDVDAALQINIASSQNAASAIVINASAGGIDITAAGAATEDIDIVNTAGSVNITSGENVADAIVLTASAGGIDILATGAATEDIDISNTGGSVNITATENVADAIVLSATAGGIDILATGAATEDIDIVNTGGSINITATEDVAEAIYIRANGGTSETIRLHADQGTGVASINIGSDVGGVTVSSGLASADAINLSASAGGVDIDGALQVNIASSQNAADAIVVSASAGGIDILATGAAGEDIDIVNTGGSVNVTATEDVAQAIYIRANGGTSETIQIHADQGTGVASINVLSDVGGITLTATGLASDDAINLVAGAGGVDIDAAMQINIASSENTADSIVINSSAGGIDITAAGAAGEDIDIVNTAGSVNISGGESVASAIVLTAGGAAGGIQAIAGTGGFDFQVGGLISTGPATSSAASPTASVTIDAHCGVATFTGFTTAAAGSQVFTISNSLVTTSTGVLVSINNEGANDAQMTVQRVTRSAGQFTVTAVNNGAAALNGNLSIAYWVLV